MKSRSEVLKSKKSAAASTAAPKQSAEERTVPLPAGKDGMIASCKACGEKSSAEKCATRNDGFTECPACGGVCEIVAPEDAAPAADVSPEMKKLLGEQAEKKAKAEAPPAGLKQKFCGECSAELTWVKHLATFVFGCGHTKEAHGIVDDPRDAKKPGTAPPGHHVRAAHAIAQREAESPRATALSGGGTRLFIPWGKARMPVDRFNSFECGGHSMTIDVPEGADLDEVMEKAFDQLQEVADRLFERQKAWYEKKLGILGVGAE